MAKTRVSPRPRPHAAPSPSGHGKQRTSQRPARPQGPRKGGKKRVSQRRSHAVLLQKALLGVYADLDDHMLRGAALAIGQAVRLTGLVKAEAVGRIIFEHIFHGDVSLWRSRRRKKISLRKLSEQPEVNLSASALSVYIGIHVMCQKLGMSVYGCKHLGVSHLRAALRLPEKEQRRLLEKAEKKQWTVEKMVRKCKKAHRKCSRQTGAHRNSRP